MAKNNPFRKGIALIVIILCVGTNIVIGAQGYIGTSNNIGQNNGDNYIFLKDIDQQPIFHNGRIPQVYPISVNNAPQILWWYDLDAPSFGSAAVNDIDGDDNLEIVFGTYFNDEHIYALNAESGTLLWKYNTGGCNDASPAIADVDLDGELEVVVPASSPYRVYCFNGATGQVEWSTSTGYPNCIDSPPAVADVDNDDKPEVILGTFYGYVFCLNGEDGSICWQTNLGTDSYIQSGPNILDLNGDGQLDIVVAQWSGDYRIYALKGDDASVLWFSDQPQDHMYHGGSFADIDEDGKPEIAIGCYDNHVYVVNGEDGSPLWDYYATYYIGAPTSIADLNNDGHLEIVFTSYNRLGVLSYTGSLLWSYTTGGSIFRGVAITDIDDDGILDVVFGSDDGILRVLQGNDGSEIWAYDLEAHYGQTYEMDHAPVIADFDNDGKLDVFIIGGYGTSSPPTNNHGRAYAIAAGEGTGPGWPMFRHDLKHSACFKKNQPPNTPEINGPTEGEVGEELTFSTSTADPDGDQVWYKWDFGDEVTDWIGPFGSEVVVNESHIWTSPGVYMVKVKAKDSYDQESDWSEPLSVIIIQLAPELEIDIKGGIGIHIIIKNSGYENATEVEWSVSVKGGILGLINASLESDIPLLEPEKEIHERILLFRLGKIEIIVTADASNAEKVTKTENAIVLFAICILIP